MTNIYNNSGTGRFDWPPVACTKGVNWMNVLLLIAVASFPISSWLKEKGLD